MFLRLTQSIFLITFLSLTVQAKDHFLLDSFGLLKASYIKKKPFEVGDRIIFDDQTIFIFEEELGRGNTSAILKVKREGSETSFALRVPQTSEIKSTPESVLKYLNGFIDGHSELELMGIRVPQLYQSRAGQFALTSIENIDFSLSEIFNPMSGLDSELREKAKNSLKRFVRSSIMYQTIGDFHYEQLVYSIEKDEWVLIDWDHFHRHAYSLGDDHFINLRAAVSEVVGARNQYRELYEHEMPQAMFDKAKADIEVFFSVLDEIVADERAELLLKERQILDDYLQKLARASDIVKILKEVPVFKSEIIRNQFLDIFSDQYFNKLHIENFDLNELLDFIKKVEPISSNQFLILFNHYSKHFESFEDLNKFLNGFTNLNLNDNELGVIQNYLDNKLFNSQLNRTEYPSHLLLDLYNSGFLSADQMSLIDNALGRSPGVLKNCLRSLKGLFKNS